MQHRRSRKAEHTSADDRIDEMRSVVYESPRPDLPALKRLFLPLSPARKHLNRMYALLDRCEPPAPPYAFQHLARWMQTLLRLEPIAARGGRWLDIASDPWFCALAMNKLARTGVEFLPTSLHADALALELERDVRYHYAPTRLHLSADAYDFGLGADFDAVMALEVIEHLKFHPVSFLAATNAALRPGGSLVITTPNVASWASIDRLLDGATPHLTPLYGGDAHHRKEYTPWELSKLVGAAGFRVIEASTFDCYASDRRDLVRGIHYLGTLAWHAATFQAKRVRNLLTRAGSTMFVHAVKVEPCDPARVASIEV